MSRYFKATVVENRQLNTEYNLLTLAPASSVKKPEPGQFYMLGDVKEAAILLKRPFSLFKNTSSGLQILYRIKGRGTTILRNRQEGSVIDVLGPLGNPYPMPEEGFVPIIIAGGVGIASVFSLAEKLAGSTYMFYGARSRGDLLMLDEIRACAKKSFISTDDGSYGEKGNILDVLNKFLTPASGLQSPNFIIYACGPEPMLKALSKIAAEKKITAYVSLEETMACGIGVCLGCVVKTAHGYERVCMEGPVFRADRIVWR